MKPLERELAREMRLARLKVESAITGFRKEDPITEPQIARELTQNLCFKIDGGWKRTSLQTRPQNVPIGELRAKIEAANTGVTIEQARIIIMSRGESEKFLNGTYGDFFRSIDLACERAEFAGELYAILKAGNPQLQIIEADMEVNPQRYIKLYEILRYEGYNRLELVA
ncbi:hypothetical protein HY990_00430 [Candidatus Micrarchaeota archaeon]|nr:hypothetical protein [Candidatus Micrarchaeota archaeon]